MTPRENLDHAAAKWPLGTCVRSYSGAVYGRVIGWRLFRKLVYIDVVCVPGHYPQAILPDCIMEISPSDMPDFTQRTW